MIRRGAVTVVAALFVIAASHPRAQTTSVAHPLGLQFSTLFTGSATDRALAVATDSGGNTFVTVQTDSTDFGAPRFLAAAEAELGFWRSALLKIHPSGTVIWARAFDDVLLTAIATDAAGNAFVAGIPPADDLVASTQRDILIAKVDVAGTVIYQARYGGSDDDRVTDIAVDPAGGLIVGGLSFSIDLPVAAGGPRCTTAAAGGIFRTGQGFVARFNANGTFVSARCLQDAEGSSVNDVMVDRAGDIWLTGTTTSADFPVTPGAAQTTLTAVAGTACGIFGFPVTCPNGFAWKMSGSDGRTLYASYFSGNRGATPVRIGIDNFGRIHLAGTTNSTDLGTPGALQPRCVATRPLGRNTPGCADGFVAQFNGAGSAVEFVTYLGGEGEDEIADAAVGADGAVYVVGRGYPGAASFPREPGVFAIPRSPPTASVREPNGPAETFVARINPARTALTIVTLPGVSGPWHGGRLAATPTGLVVVGSTQSDNFPLVKPLFSKRWGASDAILAQFGAGRRRWP